MDAIINKFRLIEKAVSQKKGNVRLLALFELEGNVPDRWDVIVSAENLISEDIESLRFVVNTLQNILTREEMVKVSKVVLFDPDDEFVAKIQRFLDNNKNPKEFRELEINDLMIKRAFVIKSPIVEDEAFKYEEDFRKETSDYERFHRRQHGQQRVAL